MNAASIVSYALPSSLVFCPLHAQSHGRPIAKGPATRDGLKCKQCASVILVGESFAWAQSWDPSMGGGKAGAKRGRRPATVSSVPSMVEASPVAAPVQAPIVQAPPAAVPVAAAPVVSSVPSTTDFDLIVSVARKVARETVSGEISTVEARIAAIEAKPAQSSPVTIVHSWTPNAAEGPAPVVAIGPVHKDFPMLVKKARAALRSGSHLWVYGGAGWGKTHHVGLLAQALGLDFGMQGAIADRFVDLLGFKSPTTGDYQRTAYRDSVEHGRLHLCDEIDASTDPGTPLAINASLSYSLAPFPDGQVKRHPNFLLVGAANTDGNGATADYVGRIRFDGAFLNRFIRVQWGEDYALETSLYPDAAPRVQDLRDRARDRGIKALITMRESSKVRGMLAEGFTLKEACEIAIGSLMTASQYQSIA